MSDATPQERIADGEQAKQAWDRFVAPAIAVLRADYMAKLTENAEKPMEGRALAAVQTMSLGLRVTREVENQLKAIILDGQQAQHDLNRAGDLSRMSPEAQRYAKY